MQRECGLFLIVPRSPLTLADNDTPLIYKFRQQVEDLQRCVRKHPACPRPDFQLNLLADRPFTTGITFGDQVRRHTLTDLDDELPACRHLFEDPITNSVLCEQTLTDWIKKVKTSTKNSRYNARKKTRKSVEKQYQSTTPGSVSPSSSTRFSPHSQPSSRSLSSSDDPGGSNSSDSATSSPASMPLPPAAVSQLDQQAAPGHSDGHEQQLQWGSSTVDPLDPTIPLCRSPAPFPAQSQPSDLPPLDPPPFDPPPLDPPFDPAERESWLTVSPLSPFTDSPILRGPSGLSGPVLAYIAPLPETDFFRDCPTTLAQHQF